MSIDSEILECFLEENGAVLEELNATLDTVEKEGLAEGSVQQIFCQIHAIRGDCAFLGFTKTWALTLAAQKLVELLRTKGQHRQAEWIESLRCL